MRRKTMPDNTGRRLTTKQAKAKKLLTGYRLLDHDPALDQFRRAWLAERPVMAQACRKSGVSTSCLRNWLNGKTRRPQNITLEYTMRALGYKRSPWTKDE
jgi:hypothetical protein